MSPRAGRRRSSRRFLVRYLGVLAIIALVPGVAFAHNPTPGSRSWSTAKVNAVWSYYKWGTGVDAAGSPVPFPTWLKGFAQDLLETHLIDPDWTNAKIIQFAYSSSGSATVYFSDSTSGVCDSVTGWQGCEAGAATYSWKIWFRHDAGYFDWCQVQSTTGCRDVYRVGTHEGGHAVGYLAHYSVSESFTVMTTSAPGKANSGWNTDHFQPCDMARLQLEYGVKSRSGPYSQCLDHIAGAVAGFGLVSTLTAAPSSGIACPGDAITASGRLAIETDDAHYLELSGDNLAARSVAFDRRVSGTSNWTLDTTSSTSTSAATGTNWSHAFAFNPSGTISYDFRAHYKKQTGQGIAESYSPIFSYTWSTTC